MILRSKAVLRSPWTWVVCVLGAGLGAFFLWHSGRLEDFPFGLSGPDFPFERPAPHDTEVVALIDRLVAVSEEGIGTHSTAWASGFIGVDEEPHFRGGILGSEAPKVDPTMRKLVRLGERALPDLLNHVTDPRRTRLSAGNNKMHFGAWWYSDEYHPRFLDMKMQPRNVNREREIQDARNVKRDREIQYADKHTIRVGDLCYVAIGQIVNRQLHVTRYQPTACLVINSPVVNPDLADAVRKDWTGLTAEQHKESLITDAIGTSTDCDPGALIRLYLYHPEAVDPIAVKLLSRPRYDWFKLREFLYERLPNGKTPEDRRKMIADYVAENGQVMTDLIPITLHGHRRNIKEADNLLAELYPGFDFATSKPIHVAEEQEQSNLINSLSNVQSEKVDRAVANLFRTWDSKRVEGFNRIWSDDLALACMDRLIGKDMDAEFKDSCERRIAELQKRKADSAESQRIDKLRQRLNKIGARQP
jgi:hypothetical protein